MGVERGDEGMMGEEWGEEEEGGGGMVLFAALAFVFIEAAPEKLFSKVALVHLLQTHLI
jgi:hypothetical protein